MKMITSIFIFGISCLTGFSFAAVVDHERSELATFDNKDEAETDFSTQSESMSELQTVPKNKAKSRQRMSAAKIAGVVVLTILGAVVVGALLGFLIVPFMIFPVIRIF